MAKKRKDAAPAKLSGVQTMVNEIRRVVANWGHLPEKEVYEALVEESEGWKMRLEELEEEDEGQE